MCTVCSYTGSNNNNEVCQIALERALFNVWLVENDLRWQVNESAAWAIYQYGKKQNEKLQSA